MASTDSTLWKVDENKGDNYWQEYEALRPNYGDSSFLELIYHYHSQKLDSSLSFGVAHDVACGSGKAAMELLKRFKQVRASDSNESSIKAIRNKSTTDGREILSTLCSAEDFAAHYPPNSADLIAAAQSFPLFDARRVLSGFAHVLKPNGTLAFWFYGRPHFSEESTRVDCQPLFDAILNKTFGNIIRGGGIESKAAWKRASDCMASWLDNVDLSDGNWEEVQRRKWNGSFAKMGFGAEFVDFDVEPYSKVADGEEMISIEDPGMWQGKWNIDGVRQFVDSSFPEVGPLVAADTQIQKLFQELEEAMGGETLLYTWPIVLVLATRSAS